MNVVVLGATGALGAAVVRRAVAAGHQVRVLARDPARVPQVDGIEIRSCDAASPGDVNQAVAGTELLFYCVNVPLKQWKLLHPEYLANALKACNRHDVKLVFPGNVWIYGRCAPGERVDEARSPAPCSGRGLVRLALESMLVKAPVRHALVRLPELYGPGVVHPVLTRPFEDAVGGKRITWLGPDLDVACELLYVDDAARALLTVGTAPRVEDETFHVPGTATTPRELLAAIAAAAGREAKLASVSRRVMRAAGIVRKDMRGLADIMHLWEDPVLLDGRKYRGRFGAPPTTALTDAVQATLAWVRNIARPSPDSEQLDAPEGRYVITLAPCQGVHV